MSHKGVTREGRVRRVALEGRARGVALERRVRGVTLQELVRGVTHKGEARIWKPPRQSESYSLVPGDGYNVPSSA